jgi:hypothetical protein
MEPISEELKAKADKFNEEFEQLQKKHNIIAQPQIVVDPRGVIPILRLIVQDESQSGETNTVEDGGKEVSKDGKGEVRPDKSDSSKKTK